MLTADLTFGDMAYGAAASSARGIVEFACAIRSNMSLIETSLPC